MDINQIYDSADKKRKIKGRIIANFRTKWSATCLLSVRNEIHSQITILSYDK